LAPDYADFGELENESAKTESQEAKKNNDWEIGNAG